MEKSRYLLVFSRLEDILNNLQVCSGVLRKGELHLFRRMENRRNRVVLFLRLNSVPPAARQRIAEEKQ